MTISQRVFYLLDKQGKKQNQLSKFTGISTSTISAWNKRGTDPAAENISAIADFFKVSTDFLLTGKEKCSPTLELSTDEQELLDNFNKLSDKSKGRLLEKAENLLELENPLTIEPKFTYIELYEMPVSAGTGIDLSGYDKKEIKVKPSAEVDQSDFCLKISGDSMEPDFHDGDIVLVKGKPKIEIGQIGIFVVNRSGYIKELGKNRLISLNDDYDDIKLTENDSVWCMGEVIGTLEEDDFLE